MNKARKEMVSKLKDILIKDKKIISAWEGGSSATGYIDEYSDLDLMLIVEDDYIESTFEKIETILEDNYGISNKLRIPEPAWHGHSQCYYLLESHQFLYLDLLIEKRSCKKDRFLEVERHGTPFVWFDKENLIHEEHIDEKVYSEKCKKTILMNEKIFPLLYTDTQKYILRNKPIDAMDLYNNILRRLVSLMNIKYRPAQYDFGIRYTYRDFPQNENDFLQKLMFVNSIEELSKNLELIKDKFYALLEELRR